MTIRSIFALCTLMLVNACGGPPDPTGTSCAVDSDCSNGAVCFQGLCRSSNSSSDAGNDAGSTVQDTGSSAQDTGGVTPVDAGVTPPADTGAVTPDAGGDQCQNDDCPCEDESDCPYDHYCNRRDGQCAPLPPGTCRDDRSCTGNCNIPEGRTVGRCVDCQVDADCAGQAPRTRCLNNTCRLPEGQCENNTDCANGQTCVDGACEGGGGNNGGGCNAQNCPPPGQCLANQCIGGGGGGGQNQCTDNSDCAANEQCLDLQGMAMCMQRCNEGIMAALCALPNLQLCICNRAGLTCNQGTGLCE